jgi:hypothetical protein
MAGSATQVESHEMEELESDSNFLMTEAAVGRAKNLQVESEHNSSARAGTAERER